MFENKDRAFFRWFTPPPPLPTLLPTLVECFPLLGFVRKITLFPVLVSLHSTVNIHVVVQSGKYVFGLRNVRRVLDILEEYISRCLGYPYNLAVIL